MHPRGAGEYLNKIIISSATKPPYKYLATLRTTISQRCPFDEFPQNSHPWHAKLMREEGWLRNPFLVAKINYFRMEQEQFQRSRLFFPSAHHTLQNRKLGLATRNTSNSYLE